MKNYNWHRVGEFAHKTLMNKNDLTTGMLNRDIQLLIRAFNDKFNQAMKFGLSREGLEMLYDESENIKEAIIKQFQPKKEESSVSALGVLGFVGLVAGLAFGVRELTK